MPPTQSEVARDRRADIESTFNSERESIEANYMANKEANERQYHEELAANAKDKRDAFIAEGLNSDGSDPQGRPQG